MAAVVANTSAARLAAIFGRCAGQLKKHGKRQETLLCVGASFGVSLVSVFICID
jgi:hypothetical protein